MSAAAGFVAPTLVSLLLVALMASSAAAERLPLRTYTTEDGLAHARVRLIVADPRGFLWFCTIDGLSRFDGAVFVTYRTADGLADPWVTDLLAARDATHWVATNNGVARLDIGARRVADDGRGAAGQRPPPLFKPIAFEGPETQRQVRVLLEDRAGRIWAGWSGGLSVLDRRGPNATFRPVVPSPPAMVNHHVRGLGVEAENALRAHRLGIVRQGAVPWTAGFAAALTVGTSLTSSAPALRAYEPLTSAAVSAEMAVVREHLHSGAVFSPNLNVCVSAFLQHGSGFGVAQVTQARVTGYLIAE